MDKLSDVIARFEQKGLEGRKEEPPPEVSGKRSRLLPYRHPTRDFFIADILDWSLKDDRHSMEHPVFSLSKKPDRRRPEPGPRGCEEPQGAFPGLRLPGFNQPARRRRALQEA